MKKTITSQVEKFNARMSKSMADTAAEQRPLEERIAKEMEEKKPLYEAIDLLQRSVMEMTRELQSLRIENAELRAIREDNRDMKATMNKVLDEVQEIRKVTVGSLYMDDKKKKEIGLPLYKTPLHLYRAQQMKEKGYFEDPTDPETLAKLGITVDTGEYETEEPEVVVAPAPVQKENTFSTPRGRKPGRVLGALETIVLYTKRPSNRMDWKAGGMKLIYAILTVAEWKNVDITSTTKVQANNETRRVFQQVMLNKEAYGVQSWSDLIAKYKEAK